MAQGICSVEGCETVGRLARTYCLTHYARWRKYGTTADPTPPTLEERWWAKVDKNGPVPERRPDLGPCWVWTGYISEYGYGRFSTELPGVDGKRKRKKHLAHRWGYQTFVGPFPDHLEVDHLCRNRACVNFERHLEPVTHAENMLRGDTVGGLNARKTHCKRGHEFNDENTLIGSGDGKRYCRLCRWEADHDRSRPEGSGS